MIEPRSVANRLHAARRHRPSTDLVEACLRGDRSAWDALVDQYGRLVYSIARRYGLDDADADDVFQSVFLTVMQKLDSLRQRERFSAWLITTTHRQCWRTTRRSGHTHEPDASVAPGPPGPDEVLRWEQQHLVNQALEELGGSCEPLLRALFAEPGPPNYERIASQLEMKIGSIGPTRARCFRKLERILVALGVEPTAEPAEPA